MKNILILLVAITTSLTALGQEKENNKKLIQKISGGLVLINIATSPVGKKEKVPFKLGRNIFSDVTLITPKTFHALRYGFGDNSVVSLNGYFLPKNWAVYSLFIKELHRDKKSLSFGVEKVLSLPNTKCFLFTHGTTNFKGSTSVSVGILLSFYSIIWK